MDPQECEITPDHTCQIDWQTVNNVLSESSDHDAIDVIKDWRAGGETYVLDFVVKEKEAAGQEGTRCIMKACVKIPCTATMQEWLDRRSAVKSAGVSTPKLYFYDNHATIIEEFIPYTAAEAYALAESSDKAVIVENLEKTYSALAEHGFDPRVMHDLRSRGTDIVVIDYGEDLGPQYDDRNIIKTDSEVVITRTLGKGALAL